MALWRSADGAGIIKQGHPLDFAHEIVIDRKTRRRYRINATGINVGGSDGVEISVRSLPIKTPIMDSVALKHEFGDYLNPKNGVIIIAGGTGHGKSTIKAAITHAHLLNKDNPRKIIDYHAPIEYTFRDTLDENLDSLPLSRSGGPAGAPILLQMKKVMRLVIRTENLKKRHAGQYSVETCPSSSDSRMRWVRQCRLPMLARHIAIFQMISMPALSTSFESWMSWQMIGKLQLLRFRALLI